ncbi:MAG: hypothetical protein CSA83_00980, partial [Actinomycetales bacterium]
MRNTTTKGVRGLVVFSKTQWLNTAVIVLLLGLAGFTHGQVFGGAKGYIAAAGGVLIGGLVALIAAKLRWDWLVTVLVLALSYLLFGGIFAVPEENIGYLFPTATTLKLLISQLWNGWLDSLTLQPPLRVFAGAAVLPLVVSMVCSAIAVTVVLRSENRQELALLPVALSGVIGILWGTQKAPLAQLLTALAIVIGILWTAWLAASRRQEKGARFLVTNQVKASPLMAIVSVLSCTAIAVGVSFVFPVSERKVFRDQIEPPLNIEAYHSPLTYFRNYSFNLKDETLFKVTNYPAGARLRLATLNAYDGVVYHIAETGPTDAFQRVGEMIGDSTDAGAKTLEVKVNEYSGNWMLGGDDVQSIKFTSQRAKLLAENLYYSAELETLFQRNSLVEGDTYQIAIVPKKTWTDSQLRNQKFAAVPLSKNEGVPDEVTRLASQITADITNPLQQVRAIESYLKDNGFFSNSNRSRAGHRAERIQTMLSEDQIVGDDEQYGVAMALMLGQLGIP